MKQDNVMYGFTFLIGCGLDNKENNWDRNAGIRLKFMSKLEHLDLADDIALLSFTQQHAQVEARRLLSYEYAAQRGLKINKREPRLC